MFKFAIGLLDFPIKTWVGQQLQRTREPPPLKTGSWTWRSISWNERRNDGKRGKMATGQLVDFRWSFRIFLIAIQEMIQFASVLSTWVEEKNPPTWYIHIYIFETEAGNTFSNNFIFSMDVEFPGGIVESYAHIVSIWSWHVDLLYGAWRPMNPAHPTCSPSSHNWDSHMQSWHCKWYIEFDGVAHLRSTAEFPKTWIWLIISTTNNKLSLLLSLESTSTSIKQLSSGLPGSRKRGNHGKKISFLWGLGPKTWAGFWDVVSLSHHCLMVDVTIRWFWYCDVSPHSWEGGIISILAYWMERKKELAPFFRMQLGKQKSHWIHWCVGFCHAAGFSNNKLAVWKHALTFHPATISNLSSHICEIQKCPKFEVPISVLLLLLWLWLWLW